MAEKKKAALSYGADLGLIQGEKAVAESLSKTGAGAKAFGEAFTKVLKSAADQKKKRDKRINDHIDDMGGVTNTPLLEIGDNKLVVTNFVRNQRDKAKEFAERLHKDRNDREALDGLAAIKQSFITLDAEIKSFTEERTEYLNTGPRMLGDSRLDADNYYQTAFAGKDAFNINEDGYIGHTVDDKPYLYKNKTNKWNTKNIITQGFVITTNTAVEKNAQEGGEFNRGSVKRSLKNHLLYGEGIGVNEMQEAAFQDFLEDDSYELEGGQSTEGISFADLYAGGYLADKFYDEKVIGKIEGYESGSTAWIADDNNADIVVELLGDYLADVYEDTHNREYVKPTSGTEGGGLTDAYRSNMKISMDKANEINSVFRIAQNTNTDVKWEDIRVITLQPGYQVQRTNADGEFDSNGGYYSLTYKDKEQDFIVKAGDNVGLRRLLMFAGGVHSSHIK